MYLALYRKYRPQTFADVISQPHITTTLINQLKNGQTSHAYLFTGSRGTGKTTCAKILAKALNCLSPVDGNPCLKCEACLAIENGASDITEIDAASNNGVDDVRALREEVMYAPVSCKYRVYIIDEVHMLSVAAFNALLKTIEEPPEHAVFILATTESHKVPATILSRCQRFEFRRINIKDSADRLLEIAQKENIQLENDAALLISRLSDGGMRDALSLLDQCMSRAERITAATVRDCAGVAGNEYLFSIAADIINSDAASALETLETLYNRSKDLARLTEELIVHFRNLMMIKALPNDIDKITLLPDEAEQYKEQCERLTMEQIMRCLTILEEGLNFISRSKQRKTQAEMCIIRLCTPKLDTDEKSLSLRIDALEQKLENGGFAAAKEIKPIEKRAITEPEPEAFTAKPIEKTKESSPKPVLFPNEIGYDEPQSAETPKAATEAPHEPQDAFSPEFDEMPPIDDSLVPPPDKSDRHYENVPSVAEKAAPAKPQPKAKKNQALYVNEWPDILDSLPPFFAILDGSEAYYNGDAILLDCNDVQSSFLSKEQNRMLLEEAAKKALGKNYRIFTQGEEKAEKQTEKTRLEQFLESAKEQGVAVINNG